MESRAGSRVRLMPSGSSPASGVSLFDEASGEEVENTEEVSETEIRFEAVEEEDTDRTDGNESEATSNAGSDVVGYATESPYNYIDMTQGDMCMIIFARQKDGERIPCVCGNSRLSCNRPGHLSKQGQANKEGLPRFYIRLPGSKGTCDGRLDRIALTREEGVKALEESRDEMARIANAMSGTEGDEDEAVVVDNASIDLTTTRDVVQAGSTNTPRASNMKNCRIARHSPPVLANTSATSRTLPSASLRSTHPEQVWIGVEHKKTSCRRYFADQPGAVVQAITKGYVVKKTFATVEAAVRWSSVQPKSNTGTTARNRRTGTSSQPVAIIDVEADSTNTSSDDSEEDNSSVEIRRQPRRSVPPQKSKKDGAKNWYGVENHRTKERAITSRLHILRKLQKRNYKLKEVFQTKEEAEQWLQEGGSYNSDVDEGSNSDDSSDDAYFSSNQPRNSRRKASMGKKGAVVTATSSKNKLKKSNKNKKGITLSSDEFFKAETAGADPSVGNKEQIYNISHDNVDEMDVALCPPHMTEDERENFLEAVVDVTALPGMFRSSESSDVMMDTDTATSIVATALGKKVSISDVMWRTPSKNAISKVKTQAQLYELISGVEKAGKIAFQQQEGRMRAIMYRCNYDRSDIQLYLQAGLLPRMMRASYDRYIQLLYKARQKVIDHGGWENGLGYEMIVHHGRETMNIRQYSVDWRNFVIQTYIYLRDAETKSYVDGTMYEGLFKREPSTQSSNNPSSSNSKTRERSSPEAGGAPLCSHCKCALGEAHPGGKAKCVFAELDMRKAKEAGRKFLSALKESPKLDRSKKIKELLEEFGGDGN